MPAHWWVELCLVSLVGTAVSRGVIRGFYGLRKTLSSLSAYGWDLFLPCWLFGLRSHNTVAYRLLVGPCLGADDPRRMCASLSFYVAEHSLKSPPSSVYVCRKSHSHKLPTQETPQDQKLGLALDPMKSLPFPWVPVCMKLCVHPPRVESPLPPVLWSACDQAPLVFKTKCSGGPSSPCQTPRLQSLMWGSELSVLWEKLCDIFILPFVVHPPGVYGI